MMTRKQFWDWVAAVLVEQGTHTQEGGFTFSHFVDAFIQSDLQLGNT